MHTQCPLAQDNALLDDSDKHNKGFDMSFGNYNTTKDSPHITATQT